MGAQTNAGARQRARSRDGRQPEAAEPRLRASLAVSLDGYIADAAGEVAWLDPYFSAEIDFQAFSRTIGATVMGRATWDWTVRDGHAGAGEARAIVQTHRPLDGAPARVEAFAGDVRELADELRRRTRPAPPLRRVHSRALGNGVVLVEYEPERSGR